ncbi:MAG: cyclic nucleotide-binding domain-containing protein [Methylococcales bacterium]|jgi:CRP/FNR family transcriptional regulator, anaerobic regulatory protein|nr:cyclic nucleotide-binding domain-containing protein [Methylococcales bacterium]MBT7410090.1 cyclic nucleotide-binding domain-containing protein [Methylococcales bacterium]
MNNQRYIECEQCNLFPICDPIKLGEYSYDFIFKQVDRRVFFKRGEVVFHQGDPANSIYALSSGTLKLSMNENNGKADESDRLSLIDFRFAGELVGLSSLTDDVYSYSAYALEDSYLCEILKDQIDGIADTIPEVQKRVITMQNQELKQMQTTMMLMMGRKTSQEKVVSFILMLMLRFRRQGLTETQIVLPMTRIEIGDYLGLTKETVIRILQYLQNKNIIHIQGKVLNVIDKKALEQIV